MQDAFGVYVGGTWDLLWDCSGAGGAAGTYTGGLEGWGRRDGVKVGREDVGGGSVETGSDQRGLGGGVGGVGENGRNVRSVEVGAVGGRRLRPECKASKFEFIVGNDERFPDLTRSFVVDSQCVLEIDYEDNKRRSGRQLQHS
ncbi:hypothetical protein Tco_1393462 [Tanacetum coccineum]|uniref:Uncharacterized protein n=1 Tax=Tanacetum coccineum TaxID=301880 RepID=A0ABQ4Z5J0_9ASTR